MNEYISVRLAVGELLGWKIEHREDRMFPSVLRDPGGSVAGLSMGNGFTMNEMTLHGMPDWPVSVDAALTLPLESRWAWVLIPLAETPLGFRSVAHLTPSRAISIVQDHRGDIEIRADPNQLALAMCRAWLEMKKQESVRPGDRVIIDAPGNPHGVVAFIDDDNWATVLVDGYETTNGFAVAKLRREAGQ